MSPMNHPFEIEFLDHVAIRVSDMHKSEQWYADVLGLEVLKFEEWGDFPVFMVSGSFGVALFPANLQDPKIPRSKNVRIDHFAFRVTPAAFRKALAFFDKKGIKHEIQDHHYFESVYLLDPDGHIVELTTPTPAIKDQN
ncbi:MAG: VOC family protein [Saprospiraceae bacterium]|nr:VOC family protein [Saprospiraceae bacterium]